MLLRLLLAIPLLFLPNALHLASEPLVAGLNFTNLLLVAVLLGIPLLAPLDAPRLPGIGRLAPALMLLFLAYVIAFVIAQVASPGKIMEDLTALKTAVFYPLFYFAYRNNRLDLRGTRQLIVLALAVAVVAGLEAIQESLAANMFQEYSHSGRASGPFGIDSLASNLAGYYYAIFLPMLVAIVLFLKGHRVGRMAALGGAMVIGLAIMATFSRQAYAVALLCVFLLALRRSLTVALLFGVLAVAGVSLLPAGVTERVGETTQSAETGAAELDTSTASRFEIWDGAFGMWRDHPAGVGLNRFKTHIGEYSTYAGFDAHNHYVLMLAEAGPLGLGALLWLVWRSLGIGRALLRSPAAADPEARAIGVGACVMVVAMALGNTFGSFYVQGLAMGSVWAFIGLIERYCSLKAAEAVDAAKPMAAERPALDRSRFPLLARIGTRTSLDGAGDAG